MGRGLRIVIGLIFVGGFILAVGIGFLLILSDGDIVNFVQTSLIRLSLSSRQDELITPMGTDDSPIRFVVEVGDTPSTIAQNLKLAGLIRDAQLFVDYVRAEGLDIELEAGTYFLNQTQSIVDIAHALTDSTSSIIIFRIPEGSRLEEIGQLIDENTLLGFNSAAFLNVVGPNTPQDPTFVAKVGLPADASLEGFMFPDTYQLPANVTPEMLRDIVLERFLDAVGEQIFVDIAQDGYTMYQIVTLASIIEREAVYPEEHPLIGSVYRNRLAAGIRLQADPTVQYALHGLRGSWWPNITPSDYQAVQSPYNTYLYLGLPPGPIANPSLSAIRGAAYPAETDYYYFRASCSRSGYHDFATTFEEHLANGC